ncbi:unnamed protein product [Adineta steineri]|uniref:Orn/DAP/Arg decarboxylase 2 N-terminal domain-containing protein n=1 Tax=Adineta steineri TaxID=433720 RepID=A0A819ADS1_9BILA|nr:unnamed protein product [Adineta steineri]
MQDRLQFEYQPMQEYIEQLISTDSKEKEAKSNGLRYVSHRYQFEKAIEYFEKKFIEDGTISDENILNKRQFEVDVQLKKIFPDHTDVYHIPHGQSDQDIARHFINEIGTDDPFYIVDVSHYPKQYMKWKCYFPDIQVFYAMKTNDNDFLIKIIERLGGGFDCASINELKTVLSLCPDIDCSKRIIYAHPCKPISHIKYFQEKNVQLTVVDNEDELIKLEKHWPNVQILIRLKTKDSKSLISFSDKFGANEHIATRLFQLAKKLNLNIVGCAFHVGTGCYDDNAFQHALQFAQQIFQIAKKYQFHLTILDIGGGFPGFDEDHRPSFSQLANTIQQSLDEFFPQRENIQIIAEPGRYFAAASMDLVASIIACRSNNKDYLNFSSKEEKENVDKDLIDNIYYINESTYGSLSNILYENTTYSITCLRKEHSQLVEHDETKYKSIVYGPTCDSLDIVSLGVDLPLLNIGDHLLFYHVGAYSSSLSMKFNGFQTTKYFYIWKD